MREIPQSVARAWQSMCEAHRSYVEPEVFPRSSTPLVAGAAGFEVENLLHGWEPSLDDDPVDVADVPAEPAIERDFRRVARSAG